MAIEKPKTLHRGLGAVLAWAMLLTACGSPEASSGAPGTPDAPSAGPVVTEEQIGAEEAERNIVGYGRRVEDEVTPEGLAGGQNVTSLARYPDDSLFVCGRDAGGMRLAFRSNDGGDTWHALDTTALNAYYEGRDISYNQIMADVNGGWWLGCRDESGLHVGTLGEDGSFSELALGNWSNGTAENAFVIDMLPTAEGMVIAVHGFEQISFVYFDLAGNKLTEVQASSYPFAYTLRDDVLYCLPSGRDTVELYSLSTGEPLGSHSLPRDAFTTEYPVMYAFAADSEGWLHAAQTNGISRYQPGDEAVEMVETSLGFSYAWPTYAGDTLVLLEDGTYLQLGRTTSQSKLYRWRYDEAMPVYESATLRVWTLEASGIVDAACHAFAKRYPEFEVVVETGQGEEAGALTDEDIIRELNTRILAGDPPDVLILDGLPSAFLTSGFLQDIGSIVNHSEFYENILECFTFEGACYAYPAQFRPGVLMADAGTGTTGGPGMSLDELEALCQSPGSFTLDGWFDLFEALYYAYSVQMFPGGDGVDEAAVAAFLRATKSLVDSHGVTADFGPSTGMVSNSFGAGRTYPTVSAYNYGQPPADYAVALLEAASDLSIAFGSHGATEVFALPGGGFLPVCTAAAPHGAAQEYGARLFIAAMLEDEDVQRAGWTLSSGFAVRRGVLENQLAEVMGRYIEYGEPPAADFTAYDWDGLLESLTGAGHTDAVLFDKVYAAAERLYGGQLSLDAAVAEVVQGTRLYFAERVA